MGSSENSTLGPLASPPPAGKGGRSEHRLRGRPAANRTQPSLTLQDRSRGVSSKGRHGEISEIVCELFREDLSYRAQARKFLWEFFD